MYKIILATSALFIMTAPSLATDSTFVHSLRADNGDFDAPGAFESRHSFDPKAIVDPVQTGSNGNVGADSTSKCLGVSPTVNDPVSPHCRN
jgi:hypothetical protein